MKNELKTLGNIREILAKAELAKELLSHLSEEDTAKVIQFLQDEGIEIDEESEPIYLTIEDLNIRVYSDPIKFGNAATLKQSEFSHSWAGDDETKSLGWVILGDVELGESYWSQYSQNGDCRSPRESYSPPNFSVGECQILLVRTQADDTFNGRDNHTLDWCLHIYQPSEYHLPEWVKELAEKFDW